jgi:hypothetical protein
MRDEPAAPPVPAVPETPAKTEAIRVVEVRPKWQRYLVIGCAVVGAVGGAGSLAVQLTQDDLVAKVDPITELANRTNSGISRVDRVSQRIEDIFAPTPATPGAAKAPDVETTYRIGPFVIKRSDRRIEIKGAENRNP